MDSWSASSVNTGGTSDAKDNAVIGKVSPSNNAVRLPLWAFRLPEIFPRLATEPLDLAKRLTVMRHMSKRVRERDSEGLEEYREETEATDQHKAQVS